jgi:hypothetical protein
VEQSEAGMTDYKVETIAKLKAMTFEELFDFTAAQQAEHWNHSAGMAEISRRQTDAQMKAAQAQIEASDAEKEAARAATTAAKAETEAAKAGIKTAEATQQSATYMRRSVTVAVVSLLLASVAAAASTVQSYVSWSGRNDLLRSTLASTAISACGENRVQAVMLSSYVATIQAPEIIKVPQGEQFQAMMKAIELTWGFFAKTYVIIESAASLGVPGTNEVDQEYRKLVAQFEADANAKGPPHGLSTLNDLSAHVQAFYPKLNQLCTTVSQRIGNIN